MINIIKPQTGIAFRLLPGQLLKVIDAEGQQVSDLFCADANDPEDTLSAGRTMDYNESVRIEPGFFLYAHSGNKLLEVIEDSSPGVHDLLVTPCSLQMFNMINKNTHYHPSCLENLTKNLAPFGFCEKRIASTLNIFMNIKINKEGRLKVIAPVSKPKDFILFKAHRDLIVGLTACSDEGTNNGSCKMIHYEILTV
ncbi:MAG: urea carboxylase-associated family protein [Bdellovibrionaceae bacterium]|nr:urea carboxylase-associated family protein [Pseudobdellovibrionaceae bacterium]